MDLSEILRFAVANGASDIHIQAGAVPMVRIAGLMRALDLPVVSPEETRKAIAGLLPARKGSDLAGAMVQGIDFSHEAEGISRFRCNAYSQMGEPGLVMRVISPVPRSIASLNLPDVIEDIALEQRGLILMAGTSGSGKSTTLAAMIDLINHTYRKKIVAIEDPIEYLHENDKSLISQLEVGHDTPSFGQGLRQALRQDPDVILVGELRDVETLRIVLMAAATGHQVFTTVHSASSAQTIERIIAAFPPAEHKLLLSQLAGAVEAIIAQRLVTAKEGGLLPAVEILRGTAVTEKFIMENKLSGLSDYIAQGELGMQSFDQHLLDMYNEEKISGTQSMRFSTNAEAMSLAMRGIRHVGGGTGTRPPGAVAPHHGSL